MTQIAMQVESSFHHMSCRLPNHDLARHAGSFCQHLYFYLTYQMAQQQLEEFINNGGMEDLISSQMEEAAAMMENGEMEAMVSQ